MWLRSCEALVLYAVAPRSVTESRERPWLRKCNPFIDDLDGSAAEGTIRFGLDGVEYEIDLSAEHSQELRDALARYLGAARRVGGSAKRPPGAGAEDLRARPRHPPRFASGPRSRASR